MPVVLLRYDIIIVELILIMKNVPVKCTLSVKNIWLEVVNSLITRVPPLVSKKDYQRAQNVFSNIYIAIRFGISSLKKNIRHQNKRPTSFLGILREYHGTNSQDISYMLIINEPNI